MKALLGLALLSLLGACTVTYVTLSGSVSSDQRGGQQKGGQLSSSAEQTDTQDDAQTATQDQHQHQEQRQRVDDTWRPAPIKPTGCPPPLTSAK